MSRQRDPKVEKRITVEKGKQGAVQLLFGRTTVIILALVLQVVVLLLGVTFLQKYLVYLYGAYLILTAVVVVIIINKEGSPDFKLAWMVPMLIFPVFGTLLYLFVSMQVGSRMMNRKLTRIIHETRKYVNQEPRVLEELEAENPRVASLARYVDQKGNYPIYRNSTVEYFPLGEDKFKRLVEELKKAEHFIFMEYFIIQEGQMWDPILEILKKKAASGVEVRLLYDDVGTLQTLPTNYRSTLEKAGIRTAIFNPFRPHLNMAMNYRDHRKITVIDGNIGYCGGLNLADEYINAYEKHGHWKDTAVMLRGQAVWNLTLMFLMMWQFTTTVEADFDRYRPTMNLPSDGFVQPFGDSPLDNLNVSETAYMQIINRAHDYVYITTPYLILDNEMVTSLINAAQSGIDVRIITPHVADKWYVHMVTRSYYAQLIRGGVKIYEYTPGFIHSKMFVSDDQVAIVGTANMDYRSFYLHFECGVSFYQSTMAAKVRDDILRTLKVCQPVELDELNRAPLHHRAFTKLLRLMAPLM